MTLYLTCGLCGRKQADGLLSRAYWGHVEAGGHGMLQACPMCKEQHSNWEGRLLATLNGAGSGVPDHPVAERS